MISGSFYLTNNVFFFSSNTSVFIKFSTGLQDYSFLFHPIFLGHVAAIACPRLIKRDKYPPFPVYSYVESVSVNQ